MKLIIDRKKWVNGSNRSSKSFGTSMLLNGKNKMCCLGFLGQACGLDDADMLGVGTPAGISDDKVSLVKGTYFRKLFTVEKNTRHKFQTNVCYDLVNTNDDNNISNKERESKLKVLFKKIGVNVSFVG